MKVEGLEQVLSKLRNSEQLYGPPFRDALQKSAIVVENEAKRLAPVDTGRLRASHHHWLDGGAVPLWAKIGPNASYARYVHDGTRPHWPPVAAIAGWARRQGIEPFLVARAISKRGTKARPWLKNAVKAVEGDVKQYLSQAAKAIEARWGK